MIQGDLSDALGEAFDKATEYRKKLDRLWPQAAEAVYKFYETINGKPPRTDKEKNEAWEYCIIQQKKERKK